MLSWFSDRYLHLRAPQIIEAQIDMLTICTGALTLLRVKAINLSQLDTWSLSIPWPPCKLGEVASKKNSQDSKWLELYNQAGRPATSTKGQGSIAPGAILGHCKAAHRKQGAVLSPLDYHLGSSLVYKTWQAWGMVVKDSCACSCLILLTLCAKPHIYSVIPGDSFSLFPF